MELWEGTIERIDEIKEMLLDLGQGENGFGGTDYGKIGFDLSDYILSLNEMSIGKNLKPGYVPQTTYWLSAENGKVIGMSRLRHKLTPALKIKGGHIGYYIKKESRGKGYGKELLNKTLQKAKALGMQKVLITTDFDNFYSIQIIEKCGGILEDKRTDAETGKMYARYWVSL